MTAGIYRNSDHPSLVEPWRDAQKRQFWPPRKSARGARIAELYAQTESATVCGPVPKFGATSAHRSGRTCASSLSQRLGGIG